MRVDVDALQSRAARQVALADAAADCVAELRSGGFGEWWRDGRGNPLAGRIAAIADRLDCAASDVGAFTMGLRRQVVELSAADEIAADVVAGRR
ncbi:hypothetical protein [Gordonia malaquae]|uniref:Uncharacterized protein n=1 Tax=Gordonia malaquae NBRC 108250 TaxID=1223542 RepID=M3VBP5_GORML|nr:hypothetical protein [Gordonia malaquae]GAC80623.1 hypothetical protein GM1_019_00850 [Gordonia malaquae NBRC 108250]